MTTQNIGYVTVVVGDYDQAITFYTESLGFELVEDTAMDAGKRWVLVRPPGSTGACLLLGKATDTEQASRIGNQTGGRVFLFLHTDDFHRDYALFLSRGVEFCEAPRSEPYGTVAVFKDICGNKWDLLQLNSRSPDA